ncbi:endonuclease/exonuclease/phosphatase family protein [Labedaea rhizosphaerae]|uniref:Endonuclease/exonuclease/phosphatase domain-containing protein n=1 Tax=Labedaea rhizosphaerae TaxID=598644 RepID=A0A4R6SHJ1_LABRH|nr:endonuclease/exonuclease/phosphatase family protein [Labedaea rhizosphaerae]TDQ01274.1 hypothetical protein EV186_1021142 [Labedaea rhizosphaerae]
MSAGTSLVWQSVNLKSGGTRVLPGDSLLRRHGSLDMEWLTRFPEVVRLSPERPHLLLLQEAKWFDRYGDELLLYVERLLRRDGLGIYRGFLTRSTRSHHHQVVFLDTARLEVAHHWRGLDEDEPSGLYGYVEAIVDGDEERTLWVKSIHLNPRDARDRLADAREIHAVIKPGQRALIGGDFNSIPSRRTREQGEPQRDFSKMPPAQRYGKGVWPDTGPDGQTAPETDALDYLIDTGWIDQHIADGNTTPTIAPGYDRGGELIIDRCLTFGALATVPRSVWVDTSDLPYSDHRTIGGIVHITEDETP